MKKQAPKILILSDFYLPGCKSGGAARTIINMIERMHDEFDFSIITRNHDGWGDFTPYETVKTGEWNAIGGVQVFYFGKEGMSLPHLRKLLDKVKPDVVYLNSFFSLLTIKFLALRRFGAIQNISVILAPEGELSAGALQIKAKKKQLFLRFVLPLGFYRNLIWKAASEPERDDIKRIINEQSEIYVAPNMSPRLLLRNYEPEIKEVKQAGRMRLIFLSRISPKKNLQFALRLLHEATGKIVFDIYGPLEDESYWKECKDLIKQMPPNVKVEFRGTVKHEQVIDTFSSYHFFILPTLNENFGHVVLEALSAGCPVLLSENTPWRDLKKKKIGWDLSLDDWEKWQTVLQHCVDMPTTEFAEWSAAARKYADEWLAAPEVEKTNREVLRNAAERKIEYK